MAEFFPEPIRLITIAPGHFHAALLHKAALPDLDRRTHVYGPLDDDLLAHLRRVAEFNTRPHSPTAWQLEIHTGEDFLERCCRERPGNVVVIAGRNKPKIDWILGAIRHGLHVLADKPWIVDAADFPKLEQTRDTAIRQDIIAWDVMTERHDPINRLVGDLANTPEIFGEWDVHSGEPALAFESVHALKKTVAGTTLRRPAWWFDDAIAGDSLADVGTHLVDLALEFVAPGKPVRHADDVSILDARRWPLPVALADFAAITGLIRFPPSLDRLLRGGDLLYAGNGSVRFTIRGVPVRATALWEMGSPPGQGDRHVIAARGTRARIHARHDPDNGLRRLFVTPRPAMASSAGAALTAWCRNRQPVFPGLRVVPVDDGFEIVLPGPLHRDHESLFALVLGEAIRHMRDPRALPERTWSNLLTKYWVTTAASRLARESPGDPPELPVVTRHP